MDWGPTTTTSGCPIIWHAVLIASRAGRVASARHSCQDLGTFLLRQEPTHGRYLTHVHRVDVESGHRAAHAGQVAVPRVAGIPDSVGCDTDAGVVYGTPGRFRRLTTVPRGGQRRASPALPRSPTHTALCKGRHKHARPVRQHLGKAVVFAPHRQRQGALPAVKSSVATVPPRTVPRHQPRCPAQELTAVPAENAVRAAQAACSARRGRGAEP
jgi:hypothetical protein